MSNESERALRRRLVWIENRLDALEAVVMPPLAPVEPPHPVKPPPPPRLDPEPSGPGEPLTTPEPLAPTRATGGHERDPLERPPRHPAPIPRQKTRPLEPAPPSRTGGDLERFFGVAVLGRIGVAAVLLAAAYFAQLAYREMGEVFKVVSIYALAGVFVAAGFVLRSRVAEKYVALLWGGGTAAAYLAGVTARLGYDLVGPYTALAMLFAASCLGQWLAHRLRHPTLASTALAGAFAAPLLVGDASDHRTMLLAYLLLLHGWAAWTERRWGWSIARLIGIVGTVAVAWVWGANHAGLDASTFAHVSVYLVGLAAPELIALARGETLDPIRAPLLLTAVAGVEGILWLLTLGGTGGLALPGFGWISGAMWTAAGVALLGRCGTDASRSVARGLVTIGGVLLALGCLGAPGVLGVEGVAAQAWTVGTLTIVALGLLLLRRVAGVGDVSAGVAAVIATLTVILGEDPATALWMVPVGLLPAAALLLTGRTPAARVAGVVTGAVTLAAGLARGHTFSATWIAAAIAACALWLGGTLAIATRREHKVAFATAALGFLALSSMWLVMAFEGPLRDVTIPLFDRGTWAALCIVGITGFVALRGRDRMPTPIAGVLWVSAIGVALLAGHRELVAAVESLARPVQDTAHVTYAALAGLGLVVLGIRKKLDGVQVVGLLLVLLACGRVIFDVSRAGTTAWTAAEIVVAAAGVVLLGRLAGQMSEANRGAVLIGFTGVAVGWAAHALAGHFPSDVPVLNLRFGAGLATVAAGFAIARMRVGLEGVRGTYMLAAGALLGYLVGLAEVLEGVEYLELGQAWPDVLVSLYTTLFAAGLLIAGFALRERRLRYPAIAGFIGVVVKIGVHDLAAATLPLRILATGVLGLVLLAAAFAYARRRDGDGSDTPDATETETLVP